ncbi:MAG TPA: 23S rRNA (adenine(2503)-C(2))-methyltransferase RlmN [Bacilli bacterium]|nr:23S rRNA (adenine(2503)-C(2))-methyltransferase RlmN [Bacilli bacterium]
MNSIYSYIKEDLISYLNSINEKKYKADQIYDWIYKKRITSFDKITNLKKDIIDKLKDNMYFSDIKILKKSNGKDVIKYLFELEDKETIEAVLMFHDYGNSVCVSTQVGCNMNCSFCESGRLKRRRNLTADELVLQILKIEADTNKRISHVVLMGIGEPFDNYENIMKFIRIINDPKGIAIGARHITISTCGIVPKIDELSNENIQVNLAISLHAPNDNLRSKLMPINNIYNISTLIKSVKNYIDKTNRRVTFEYIMLKDINDSVEYAIELSKLLKGINCYVNLIPYNETENIEFKRSENYKILEFYDILKKNNINVTIRREFGGLLSAACGQLRANN